MMKVKGSIKNRVVHPQEIEVWYAIPAIRREIAMDMKRRGIAQKEIASILGITGAAVSQYLSKKRGHDIKFDEKLKGEVWKSVDRILTDNNLVVREVQRILDLPEIRMQLCEIHGQCEGSCGECRVCGWAR